MRQRRTQPLSHGERLGPHAASLGATNNVYVDAKDNVWVFDRCEDKRLRRIERGADLGTVARRQGDEEFRRRLFVFPHAVVPDKDGNVWVVDGQAKDGKGNQVMKLSPDGKVLMTLGKAGARRQGPGRVRSADVGGDCAQRRHLRRRRPCADLRQFAHHEVRQERKIHQDVSAIVGSGDGEFKSPHVIAFDSQGRLFVADRSNSRVDIFDQDGKFLAAWKQFGRPSGIWIDKNDMLYVADSESEDAPGKDTNNPGCKRGVRVGSVKTGKVDYYIPPPPVSDPKLPTAGRCRRRFPRQHLPRRGAGQVGLQICEELTDRLHWAGAPVAQVDRAPAF